MFKEHTKIQSGVNIGGTSDVAQIMCGLTDHDWGLNFILMQWKSIRGFNIKKHGLYFKGSIFHLTMRFIIYIFNRIIIFVPPSTDTNLTLCFHFQGCIFLYRYTCYYVQLKFFPSVKYMPQLPIFNSTPPRLKYAKSFSNLFTNIYTAC